MDGNQQLEPDSASLFASFTVKSFNEYEQTALHSRSDFQTSVLRQQVSASNMNIAKNSYWPTISVGASDQYSRPNQRIFPLTDEFKNTWDIGINLNFDLTNLYSNKHNINDAKAVFDQNTAQQSILSDNIRSEVNQAYRIYTQTVERVKVLEEAVVQAEENLRINENKYRNKLSLQSDLLDADNALLKTKIDLLNTKADASLAYYRLLKTSGLLPTTF
jgi:outer membrane protein TolC